MSQARVWRDVVGVEQAVIEAVAFDEAVGAVVVSVRARRRSAGRCGVCLRRCRGYDRGRGRRRWRHLDAGLAQVWLEAETLRVSCPDHGVVAAHVPWARHGGGHTRAFDDTVAWLASSAARSMVAQLLGIAWRTVGAIVGRVSAEALTTRDPLAGLRRIGIDEISYKRGHKYLTVVVDHDSRRLVWAGVGRQKATLKEFFDLLGEERCAQIEQVSADMAAWIADMVSFRCPNAVQCADPFHLVAWCTEAVDTLRRDLWRQERTASRRQKPVPGQTPAPRRRPGPGGPHGPAGSSPRDRGSRTAQTIKDARWALLKNPADLTTRQRRTLAQIAANNKPLHRAWELKEAFRKVIRVKGTHGRHLLDDWLTWASRSRLQPFVVLARRIRAHRHLIDNMLTHGLSNGLIESTNTKIRLLTRIAFGFHNPRALIALAMLTLGGYRPEPPIRAARLS